MGGGFVIYGEYPPIDKSHPLGTNPNPSQWIVKMGRKFSTNEKLWNWSCDTFSANHRSLFKYFKSLKGNPLQIYFIRNFYKWGCGLSLRRFKIIRDANFYAPWVYRGICQKWGLKHNPITILIQWDLSLGFFKYGPLFTQGAYSGRCPHIWQNQMTNLNGKF